MVAVQRVTYDDMWADAEHRAGLADDLLREYQKLEDALEPVAPGHVAYAARVKAIAMGQANLIAFCERNKDIVKKRIEEERAEEAARAAAAAAAPAADEEAA